MTQAYRSNIPKNLHPCVTRHGIDKAAVYGYHIGAHTYVRPLTSNIKTPGTWQQQRMLIFSKPPKNKDMKLKSGVDILFNFWGFLLHPRPLLDLRAKTLRNMCNSRRPCGWKLVGIMSAQLPNIVGHPLLSKHCSLGTLGEFFSFRSRRTRGVKPSGRVGRRGRGGGKQNLCKDFQALHWESWFSFLYENFYYLSFLCWESLLQYQFVHSVTASVYAAPHTFLFFLWIALLYFLDCLMAFPAWKFHRAHPWRQGRSTPTRALVRMLGNRLHGPALCLLCVSELVPPPKKECLGSFMV